MPSVRSVEIDGVKAYLTANPVFKERERERDGLHIAHSDDASKCMFACRGQKKALPATDQQEKNTKVFTRALSFVLMDSFLSQETLSHPLLVPILEDPKMELKTFLLPLRLGLLTAFQQSNEVIFFVVVLPSVSSVLLTDYFK